MGVQVPQTHLHLVQHVAREVHHDRDQVRPPQRVHQPRGCEVGRDRRGVHELDLDVLEPHRARHGLVRGEGVVRHVHMGVGQGPHDRALARVRHPHQGHLARARSGHVEDVRVLAAALLAPGVQGGLELAHAALDVRLQPLGPLVLGDRAEHLLQRGQTLLVRGGPAEPIVCCLVVGCQVGRHGCGSRSSARCGQVRSWPGYCTPDGASDNGPYLRDG